MLFIMHKWIPYAMRQIISNFLYGSTYGNCIHPGSNPGSIEVNGKFPTNFARAKISPLMFSHPNNRKNQCCSLLSYVR